MVSSLDDINPISVLEFSPETPSVSISVSKFSPETPSVPVSISSSTLNISLLSAAAFKKAMRSEGAQCFSAFIRNPVNVSGRRATPASESDLEGVVINVIKLIELR